MNFPSFYFEENLLFNNNNKSNNNNKQDLIVAYPRPPIFGLPTSHCYVEAANKTSTMATDVMP